MLWLSLYGDMGPVLISWNYFQCKTVILNCAPSLLTGDENKDIGHSHEKVLRDEKIEWQGRSDDGLVVDLLDEEIASVDERQSGCLHGGGRQDRQGGEGDTDDCKDNFNMLMISQTAVFEDNECHSLKELHKENLLTTDN